MPVTRQRVQRAGSPEGKTGGRQSFTENARKVSFAPGPYANKYHTKDGHPNREGNVAHPKRSLGLSWGHDLTPGSIKELESQLGEENRPSIDRLKRRVGLLPLRKRPQTFLSWMVDSSSTSTSDSDEEYAVNLTHPTKRRQKLKGNQSELSNCSRLEDAEPCVRAELGCQARTAQTIVKEIPQLEGQLNDSHIECETGICAANTAATNQSAQNGRKLRQKILSRLIPPNRSRSGISFTLSKATADKGESNQQSVSPLNPVVTFKRKNRLQQSDIARSSRPATAAAGHLQRLPEIALGSNCSAAAVGEGSNRRSPRKRQGLQQASRGKTGVDTQGSLDMQTRRTADCNTEEAAGVLPADFNNSNDLPGRDGKAHSMVVGVASSAVAYKSIPRNGTADLPKNLEAATRLPEVGIAEQRKGSGLGKPLTALLQIFRKGQSC